MKDIIASAEHIYSVSIGSTAVSLENKKVPFYRPPIRERLRIAWRNRGCWKIKLAWWVLRRAIVRDVGFKITIHANIAMPIYDATRSSDYVGSGLSGEQCNKIADQLMKHIFLR